MIEESTPDASADNHVDASARVFERAAELFAMLSTPVRLRIVSELCGGERHVSDLLARVDATQSNLSQHLNMMYRSGLVARRRVGAQIFYRIADETSALACRVVCTQIAIELDDEGAPLAAGAVLSPGVARRARRNKTQETM